MKSEIILKSLTLTTLFAVLSTGCGKANTESDLSEQYSDARYQAASCEYAATEGGSVDRNYLNTANVVATYFGKHFDYAPVQAVMGASVQNTLDFFNSNQGVRVFKVETPSSACKPFASLPPAPSDFKRQWDQASGGLGGGLSLIGLFLNKNTDNAPSTQESAEIGVREDANRWVVVHEFMHSRFDAYVNAHGISTNELKKNLNAHLDQLKTFEHASDTDLTAIRGMTTVFVSLNQELSEFLRRYYLEEVTIETFLQLHYSEFSYMPELIDSSNAYIQVSAKKATDQIEKMNGALSALIKIAGQNQLYDVATNARNELEANQNLQRELTRTLVLTYAYSSRAQSGMSEKITSQKELTSIQFNCGHDQDLEEITKRFNFVMRKFTKR